MGSSLNPATSDGFASSWRIGSFTVQEEVRLLSS
ncbi:hypothetical protein BIW11_04238 [Tropilaelaps mercedesae]|uniref:Uncharacterized protein n=1 Tax=Tropilaelaps mercedesae TaxID=418985 RepID=A0A1V9X9P8_9ACAR|nr:hypothetical protein BIW11_04238 [Tropilaelaps mercedesae]